LLLTVVRSENKDTQLESPNLVFENKKINSCLRFGNSECKDAFPLQEQEASVSKRADWSLIETLGYPLPSYGLEVDLPNRSHLCWLSEMGSRAGTERVDDVQDPTQENGCGTITCQGHGF
jgi:hypothetical protein